MSRDSNYEPEKYRCSDCKHYHNNCKRVDGKILEFAKPWFLSTANNGIVCCDFELCDHMIYAKKNWVDFETYFTEFIENWLPYANINKLEYFTLNGDTTVRYGVKMLDYVYGHMWLSNGVLNAVEKVYYKRCRNEIGYKLIREKINGVTLKKKGANNE